MASSRSIHRPQLSSALDRYRLDRYAHMRPEALIFPRGVRYPRIDEIPGGAPSDAAARIREAQHTPITTGFVRIDRPDAQDYTAVVEANVHASNLWAVFADLVTELLPEAAAPIVGVIDDEPELGAYTRRDAAIE